MAALPAEGVPLPAAAAARHCADTAAHSEALSKTVGKGRAPFDSIPPARPRPAASEPQERPEQDPQPPASEPQGPDAGGWLDLAAPMRAGEMRKPRRMSRDVFRALHILARSDDAAEGA